MDIGDFIGGLMAGVARARRDADMTAASIAEEYKLNNLLSQVPAPRIRLADIEIDIPVVLSAADPAVTTKSGGSAMTAQATVAALEHILRREIDDDLVLADFVNYASKDMEIVFGGRVTDISGEAIVRAAQRAYIIAHQQSVNRAEQQSVEKSIEKRVSKDSKAEDKEDSTELSVDDSSMEDSLHLDRIRSILDIEGRRIGREIETPSPSIQVMPQTEMVKSMGTENTITRLKLKLVEEGLEWSTSRDANGNKIGTLTPE